MLFISYKIFYLWYLIISLTDEYLRYHISDKKYDKLYEAYNISEKYYQNNLNSSFVECYSNTTKPKNFYFFHNYVFHYHHQ